MEEVSTSHNIEHSSAVGGRLEPYYKSWCELTSDPFIRQAIRGYKIEFDPTKFPPKRDKPLYPYKRDQTETAKIDAEIISLETKNVIERCDHEEGEFLSEIFTRPKKNGGTRIILDLSDLNKSVEYQHFKMDNIVTVKSLLSEGYYMASVDLRDAYYTVPVHYDSRKYLRFNWKGQLWQFRALPNGLTSAPRLFTKVLKPILASLRSSGHLVLAYLDDTIIIGKSRAATLQAVQATVKIFSRLGFIIHPEKSVLEPRQELEFLGYQLNTATMKISLPNSKSADIKDACIDLYNDSKPTIRKVAKIIGKIVATFPAAQYGPLHYRKMEIEKIEALKIKGHFDRPMYLSDEARIELKWWIENVSRVWNPICRENPSTELRTDASGQGWGATDLTSNAGGRWNAQELEHAQSNEINFLETLAAGLGLKAFCSQMRNTHVLLRLDNSTAVAYINNMGGVKSRACNEMAIQIWNWCSERNIWITAAHLAGSKNVEADFMSRKFNDNTEWMLDVGVFREICKKFGSPKIDLFASRLNTQLPTYISWLPDPNASAVDAFTLDWHDLDFYAFPPFCLIPKCLQKIRQDNAQGIMVVPCWPTQPWFPLLNDMLIGEPWKIENCASLVRQPVSNIHHPLANLTLFICRLGVNTCKIKDSQQEQ